MKRAVLAFALAGGVALTSVPAHAALGGQCDGKVDVMCQEHPCQPEYPCHLEYCLVWTGNDCGLT